jgi:hypothetical protein
MWQRRKLGIDCQISCPCRSVLRLVVNGLHTGYTVQVGGWKLERPDCRLPGAESRIPAGPAASTAPVRRLIA